MTAQGPEMRALGIVTGRESTEPLDPARLAEIAEDHWQANTGQHAGRCDFCGDGWPCGPKLLLDEVDRLTKSLAAERTRVQRVEARCISTIAEAQRDGLPTTTFAILAIRADEAERVLTALAGDTEGPEQ